MLYLEFYKAMSLTCSGMELSLEDLEKAVEQIDAVEHSLSQTRGITEGGEESFSGSGSDSILLWDKQQTHLMMELVHGRQNATSVIRSIEQLEALPASILSSKKRCDMFCKCIDSESGIYEDDDVVNNRLTWNGLRDLSCEMAGLYNVYAIHSLALGTAKREDKKKGGRRRSAQIKLEEQDEHFEAVWNLYRSILFSPIRSMFTLASFRSQLLVAVARAVELQENVQLNYHSRWRRQKTMRDESSQDDLYDEEFDAYENELSEQLMAGCAGSFRQKLLNVIQHSVGTSYVLKL